MTETEKELLRQATAYPYVQHPVWRTAWKLTGKKQRRLEPSPGSYVEMDANDDEYRDAE